MTCCYWNSLAASCSRVTGRHWNDMCRDRRLEREGKGSKSPLWPFGRSACLSPLWSTFSLDAQDNVSHLAGVAARRAYTYYCLKNCLQAQWQFLQLSLREVLYSPIGTFCWLLERKTNSIYKSNWHFYLKFRYVFADQVIGFALWTESSSKNRKDASLCVLKFSCMCVSLYLSPTAAQSEQRSTPDIMVEIEGRDTFVTWPEQQLSYKKAIEAAHLQYRWCSDW